MFLFSFFFLFIIFNLQMLWVCLFFFAYVFIRNQSQMIHIFLSNHVSKFLFEYGLHILKKYMKRYISKIAKYLVASFLKKCLCLKTGEKFFKKTNCIPSNLQINVLVCQGRSTNGPQRQWLKQRNVLSLSAGGSIWISMGRVGAF